MDRKQRIAINPYQCASLSRHQMLGELLGLEEADVVEAALRYARRRVDHPVFAA